MSSEIVFTILLQHILTFDQEGGGKSWGEAEVRMMLDQWKPFKCFTQTECFTAALWNDDWKLFFLLLTPCCPIQKLSWLWLVQPRPPFVLVSDFSLLNPPSPPLFLDQNLDNTGPTKLLPRWSPSRSPYSSSSWSPSTWSSTSWLTINDHHDPTPSGRY